MLELLEKLCSIGGVSGREDKVREFIISEIDGFADWRVDPLGNLIVHKKGKNPAKNKVMFDAHMDEVGMIVTYITDEGMLKFRQSAVSTRACISAGALRSGTEE